MGHHLAIGAGGGEVENGGGDFLAQDRLGAAVMAFGLVGLQSPPGHDERFAHRMRRFVVIISGMRELVLHAEPVA